METEGKRRILYRPFLKSCNTQNSNLSTTFTKAVNDVRDSGLSVKKSRPKVRDQKINTAGSIKHPPPPRITICFVRQILVAKPIFIHKPKRKHDKHSAGWLTHQFASRVFLEKCCFVDVRKLGQVYEDWAT